MWLAIGTGAAGPAPGDNYKANEPDGYSQLTERPFDSITEDGWSETSVGLLSIETDSSAPHTPSNVGRAKYPLGFSGGSGPINISKSWTKVAELYVYFAWKVSANWQGHDSGVNKICFVVADDYGGGGDPAYFAAFGANADSLRFQVRLQGPGDESSEAQGSNLVQTEGGAFITRDVWYEIEVQLIANSINAFDGECRVWIDGTLTHQYTDVKFFDDTADASARKFEKIRWSGTWGGVGDTVDEDMFYYTDHIYVSGL